MEEIFTLRFVLMLKLHWNFVPLPDALFEIACYDNEQPVDIATFDKAG